VTAYLLQTHIVPVKRVGWFYPCPCVNQCF
jgi:hypothetical protein